MRRYLLNGCISLMFAWVSMPANAVCTFVNEKTNISVFSFDVSKEDCELIGFNGESLVTIQVEYPAMKIVSYKNRSDNIITLMVSPISVPPFDIDRSYDEIKVVESIDGVELLNGSMSTYRLAGRDGSNAYISKWQSIYVGKRAYKGILKAHYLFGHELSKLKKVDHFVVRFLDVFLIN